MHWGDGWEDFSDAWETRVGRGAWEGAQARHGGQQPKDVQAVHAQLMQNTGSALPTLRPTSTFTPPFPHCRMLSLPHPHSPSCASYHASIPPPHHAIFPPLTSTARCTSRKACGWAARKEAITGGPTVRLPPHMCEPSKTSTCTQPLTFPASAHATCTCVCSQRARHSSAKDAPVHPLQKVCVFMHTHACKQIMPCGVSGSREMLTRLARTICSA